MTSYRKAIRSGSRWEGNHRLDCECRPPLRFPWPALHPTTSTDRCSPIDFKNRTISKKKRNQFKSLILFSSFWIDTRTKGKRQRKTSSSTCILSQPVHRLIDVLRHTVQQFTSLDGQSPTYEPLVTFFGPPRPLLAHLELFRRQNRQDNQSTDPEKEFKSHQSSTPRWRFFIVFHRFSQ